MTDKELKKLSRAQLLELLVDQSREIDRLREELAVAQQRVKSRDLMMEHCGSIADASLELCEVFNRAQEAAELYLRAAKKYVAQQIAEGRPLPETLGRPGEKPV